MTRLKDSSAVVSASETISPTSVSVLAPGEQRAPIGDLSPSKRNALVACFKAGGLNKKEGAWHGAPGIKAVSCAPRPSRLRNSRNWRPWICSSCPRGSLIRCPCAGLCSLLAQLCLMARNMDSSARSRPMRLWARAILSCPASAFSVSRVTCRQAPAQTSTATSIESEERGASQALIRLEHLTHERLLFVCASALWEAT
jgi:hypothetical protein